MPAVSNGQLITIGIEAVVNNVTNGYNLEGKVTVGSTITGSYTYDTDTLDTNPTSFIGGYSYNSSSCGITLNIDELVFYTNIYNVDFRMTIVNDSPDIPGDGYSWCSYNNNDLDNGAKVDSIYWQLIDNTGTALSSTALPTTAPVLSDWAYNDLSISGPGYGSDYFFIGATVTSAVLIPEPATLLLFSIGTLLLRKSR